MTFSGFQAYFWQTRLLSPSSTAMRWSGISKSRWKFSLILSGVTLLGITVRPLCVAQRSSTCNTTRLSRKPVVAAFSEYDDSLKECRMPQMCINVQIEEAYCCAAPGPGSCRDCPPPWSPPGTGTRGTPPRRRPASCRPGRGCCGGHTAG